MAERHQVVIIGGGFGGLNAARGLTGPHLDVTLVDRTNHHLFQPLLYQVAAGILPPGLIAPALRSAVRSASNVRTLLADVHDIDLDAKTVRARRTTARSPCPTTASSWRPGPPTRTSARTTSPRSRRG
jgi:NADH dehydrogenase